MDPGHICARAVSKRSEIVHGAAILIGNGQRRSVLNRGDAETVPAVRQKAERSGVLSERQIVAVVDDEALWMAESDRTILLCECGGQIAVRATASLKLACDIAQILAKGVRRLHQEAMGKLLSQGHLKAVVVGDAVESGLLEAGGV